MIDYRHPNRPAPAPRPVVSLVKAYVTGSVYRVR